MLSTLPAVTPAIVRALPTQVTSIAAADAILRAQTGMSARTVRANLRAVYAGATGAQRAMGVTWYAEAILAGQALDTAHHMPAGIGACLIAATSPRTRWADNLVHAAAIARGEMPLGIMGANLQRALRVQRAWLQAKAAGESDVAAVAAARLSLGNGPKVAAFAVNCAGDLQSAVTVDVWAVRAALAPTWQRGSDVGALCDAALTRKGVYAALAYLYAVEAHRAGVAPAVFQAIVWCAISRAA
jgi:hypothetical protein